MGLLEGKKALVMGVGNKRSIAWGIATAFQREGADLAFNWPTERLKENVLELVNTLPRHEEIPVGPCDVSKQEEIDAFFAEIERRWGKLDILVHSIAFAAIDDLKGRFHEISREGLSYQDAGSEEGATGPQHYVEQIKLANREVFSLYELAREFSSSLNLSETLDMFTKKVREFVPFSTCVLYLLDPAKRIATASHVEGEYAGLLSLRQIKIGDGATGYALKSRLPVKKADPDLDFAHSQSELASKYSTMASVPLIADAELIGAITIYSRELQAYEDEHIRLLETISRIAAEAIGKSLKHDEATTHALTDPMTGLPNARSLQKHFEKEAGRAARSSTNLQLLMLDLDGFKAVNDSFGHKIGDKMLAEISQVIRGQLRDYDFLARYGGDEFVAIVPDMSREDVIELCDRIESAVSNFKLSVSDNVYASVGVSLGSASYPVNGETFDQLVIAADKIMYERKLRRKAESGQVAEPEDPLELPDIGTADSEGFIVELDETHVIAAAAGL